MSDVPLPLKLIVPAVQRPEDEAIRRAAARITFGIGRNDKGVGEYVLNVLTEHIAPVIDTLRSERDQLAAEIKSAIDLIHEHGKAKPNTALDDCIRQLLQVTVLEQGERDQLAARVRELEKQLMAQDPDEARTIAWESKKRDELEEQTIRERDEAEEAFDAVVNALGVETEYSNLRSITDVLNEALADRDEWKRRAETAEAALDVARKALADVSGVMLTHARNAADLERQLAEARADVERPCEECGGKAYRDEVQTVTWWTCSACSHHFDAARQKGGAK